MEQLPLYRLYLLRAAYLLIGLGQGVKTWPAIVSHSGPLDFWNGVSLCFFGALTALCLIFGVRYPVKMLPLLIFEFTWKTIWLLGVWLPLALGHQLDADNAGQLFPIGLGVVIVPLFLPWAYVWKTYISAPADRWR